MADKAHPAVQLPANSFELRDLEKSLDQAYSVKDEDKHPERVAKAIRDSAQLPDVLTEGDKPALPPGTKLAEVETVAGQKVQAPVSIPAEDVKSGEEAAALELPSTAQVEKAAEASGGAAGAGEGAVDKK